jgi:hypothetical protein
MDPNGTRRAATVEVEFGWEMPEALAEAVEVFWSAQLLDEKIWHQEEQPHRSQQAVQEIHWLKALARRKTLIISAGGMEIIANTPEPSVTFYVETARLYLGHRLAQNLPSWRSAAPTRTSF